MIQGFLSLTTEIEAVFSLRPTTFLSSDSSDFNPFATGFFLIDYLLTDILEPVITSKSDNRLFRGKKGTKIVEIFLNRGQRNNLFQRHESIK